MAVAAAVTGCATVSAAVPRYKVEMFVGGRDNNYFRLEDVNDRGQVVGFDMDLSATEGFVWSQGIFRHLSIHGVDFRPARINNQGLIAGSVGGSAYIYDTVRGTAVNINTDDGRDQGFSIRSINRAGHVLGSNNFEDGAGQWFYDGRTTRSLGIWEKLDIPPYNVEVWDMNDHGVVIGSYRRSGEPNIVFTLRDGMRTDIARADGLTNAFGINNAGALAGEYQWGEDLSTTRPVLYRDGESVDLLGPREAVPGQGRAWDLNDQGWVVGSGATPDGRLSGAFLYRDGQLYDLDDLLVPWQARRWSLDWAHRINEQGQILAAGSTRDAAALRIDALLTPVPVPEPPAWALLLAGCLVLGVAVRRHAGAGATSLTARLPGTA